MSVCFGCARRRPENLQTEASDRFIYLLGEDAVAKQVLVCTTADRLRQLLCRPGSCRVMRHVHVEDPTGSVLHDDEYIDQLECRRDRDEEIAGDDAFRMVPKKR